MFDVLPHRYAFVKRLIQGFFYQYVWKPQSPSGSPPVPRGANPCGIFPRAIRAHRLEAKQEGNSRPRPPHFHRKSPTPAYVGKLSPSHAFVFPARNVSHDSRRLHLPPLIVAGFPTSFASSAPVLSVKRATAPVPYAKRATPPVPSSTVQCPQI